MTPDQLAEVAALSPAARQLVRDHKRALEAVRTLRAALRVILDRGVQSGDAATASKALRETSGIAD